VGKETDVDFVPFYRLHRRTYAIYWISSLLQVGKKKAGEIAAERERQHKLELATVAFANPAKCNLSATSHAGRRHFHRSCYGPTISPWPQLVSFDLPVDPTHPMTLVASYYSDEWRKRTFDILIEGEKVGNQTIEKGGPVHFFDAEYPIPANLVASKQKVTVRFQATNGNEIGAVFGLRMIRADEPH